MPYWSRDGVPYKSYQEQKNADREWEKKELIKQQNALLKESVEQQKKAFEIQQKQATEAQIAQQRALREAELERREERREQARRSLLSDYEKTKRFLKMQISAFHPVLVEQCGIKNPDAYLEKLFSLYNCKTMEPEAPIYDFGKLYLEKINKLEPAIIESVLQKIDLSIRELESKFSNCPISEDTRDLLVKDMKEVKEKCTQSLDKLNKANFKVGLSALIALFLCVAVSLTTHSVGAGFFVASIMTCIYFATECVKKKRRKTGRTGKRKGVKAEQISSTQIELINQKIDNINQKINETELSYHENLEHDRIFHTKKIRAYESRRIEHFNMQLEYVLEKLTELYSAAYVKLNAINESLERPLISAPVFSLQYYEYPRSYNLFKQEIQRQEEIENGTEVFNGLI